MKAAPTVSTAISTETSLTAPDDGRHRPRRAAAADRRLIAARRRWAYALIRRCPEPAPAYGSQAWHELPEGDPAKVAGCVVAAESWARAGDTLEADLRREVEDLRRGHKRAEDAEYAARAAEHRARWQPPTGPTFVQRRKAQLDDCQPRPGDRPGRSDGGAA